MGQSFILIIFYVLKICSFILQYSSYVYARNVIQRKVLHNMHVVSLYFDLVSVPFKSQGLIVNSPL